MPAKRRACRILVVDDDAGVRAVLTQALVMEGYRVVEARGGEVGVTLVAAEPPALIILDLRMPSGGGRALAAGLAARGVVVPILALSAVPGIEEAAREFGAADWLAKPFDLDALLAKVENLCPLAGRSVTDVRPAPADSPGPIRPSPPGGSLHRPPDFPGRSACDSGVERRGPGRAAPG